MAEPGNNSAAMNSVCRVLGQAVAAVAVTEP